MKNTDLMRDMVEMTGEMEQFDNIANSCLKLALAIQEYKKANFKENNLDYNEKYNYICEKIADMKIMLEQGEFLFNSNTINEHYRNKLDDIRIKNDSKLFNFNLLI